MRRHSGRARAYYTCSRQDQRFTGEMLLLNNQMFSVSNVSVFRKQRIQCSLVCIKTIRWVMGWVVGA